MSNSTATHVNSATHANERVQATMTLSDPRLVAKIIHLSLRHGCTYTKLRVHRSGDSYETHIEFEGPEDGLRRLRTQLEKITHEETALLHDHDKTTLLHDKEIS
jgi:glycine cleavage system regulatory protein